MLVTCNCEHVMCVDEPPNDCIVDKLKKEIIIIIIIISIVII